MKIKFATILFSSFLLTFAQQAFSQRDKGSNQGKNFNGVSKSSKSKQQSKPGKQYKSEKSNNTDKEYKPDKKNADDKQFQKSNQNNPDKQYKQSGNQSDRNYNNNYIKNVNINHYQRKNVVVVKPRTVERIKVLPSGYHTVLYGKRKYYCHGGYYYNYYNGFYTPVFPPFGFRISLLPVGYHTIYIGGFPRYYYRGVYYRQIDNQYETIAPETGTLVPELPEYNVEEVTIDGMTYYAYDDILYKPVVTKDGVQYEVVGILDK